MKPIIINMNEMSDSTEVYQSKPNRAVIYTIYLILIMTVTAFIWMYFFKMDIVVKSNGMFRGNASIYTISSGITGQVFESKVSDGQYVNEGDILYVIDMDNLDNTILYYQRELENIDARLQILGAYESSLNGDLSKLEAVSDNQYYIEFANRRELLYANIDAGMEKSEEQSEIYQQNINSINETIQKYSEKLKKLQKVEECIQSRTNSFEVNENYYNSLVSAYIASYDYTALQYDNQISEFQSQADAYNEQIQSVSGVSDSIDENVSQLQKQCDEMKDKIKGLEHEKSQALFQLEVQQLSGIEQQIDSLTDTMISLQSNLTSVRQQLSSSQNVSNENVKKIQIMTEKENIAKEILNYQERKEECENYLKGYDIQNHHCTITASTSGYYYAKQDIKQGTYVGEGTAMGKIYPENTAEYYAEVYVQNSDIAKIHVGDEVKFEIAAYPSSEYGYFIGTVSDISKDITVDENSGSAYYLVKVECDNMTIRNNEGEEAVLMNGMACQAKIIIDEKRVMNYVLEKIDLLD